MTTSVCVTEEDPGLEARERGGTRFLDKWPGKQLNFAVYGIPLLLPLLVEQETNTVLCNLLLFLCKGTPNYFAPMVRGKFRPPALSGLHS